MTETSSFGIDNPSILKTPDSPKQKPLTTAIYVPKPEIELKQQPASHETPTPVNRPSDEQERNAAFNMKPEDSPLNSTPTQPQQDEKRPQNIIVLYNATGSLTNRIIWDYENLCALEEASGLRTHVVIVNDDATPEQGNIATMGEVLAWKRIGDIRDLFNRKRSIGNQTETTVNFEKHEARIAIHDQVIAKEMMERNKGIFDRKKYIERVNKLVHQSLIQVARAEKLYQINSILKAGQKTILYTAGSLTSLGTASFIMREAYRLSEIPGFQFGLESIIVGTIGGIFGLVPTIAMLIESQRFQSIIDNNQRVGNPYLNSIGDLNPFRHLKRLGQIFKESMENRTLVKLKPFEQPK